MPENRRFFAVVDPSSDRRQSWLEVFKKEWVELESHQIIGIDIGNHEHVLVRVKVESLDPGAISRWASMMAIRNQVSYASVISEIYQGEGMLINARYVALCSSPEEGNEFWKMIAQAEAHTKWKRSEGIEDQ